MNDKQLYIEFTKRDNDKRIVEGFASTEALDSQGEVVKLSAIEKALPDYMKFGNIREMHQFSAVGKAVHAQIDNVKKGLRLVAKIIDKDAWEKVKEGVYNGYSIGGRVLKRIDNTIEELSLNEISLVDRPANPEAVFTMVKLDHELTNKPMEMKHTELMVAGHILDLARELRMTLDMFQYEGRSTKELSTALSVLKNLAVKILNQEDKVKFDKILYDINFQELEKYTTMPKVAEEEEKKVDLKKFIDGSWTSGYFENVKKALG